MTVGRHVQHYLLSKRPPHHALLPDLVVVDPSLDNVASADSLLLPDGMTPLAPLDIWHDVIPAAPVARPPVSFSGPSSEYFLSLQPWSLGYGITRGPVLSLPACGGG